MDTTTGRTSMDIKFCSDQRTYAGFSLLLINLLLKNVKLKPKLRKASESWRSSFDHEQKKRYFCCLLIQYKNIHYIIIHDYYFWFNPRGDYTLTVAVNVKSLVSILIPSFDLFSVSTLTSLSALLLTLCLSFVPALRCHPSLLSTPPGWTASTRSMWRSAWLQVNAPRSHSSSPSTTRWRWNRPLSWWRVEGESRCLLPFLPLFPCSKYWIPNCSNGEPETCSNEH